jgi:hypothetical protein
MFMHPAYPLDEYLSDVESTGGFFLRYAILVELGY